MFPGMQTQWPIHEYMPCVPVSNIVEFGLIGGKTMPNMSPFMMHTPHTIASQYQIE